MGERRNRTRSPEWSESTYEGAVGEQDTCSTAAVDDDGGSRDGGAVGEEGCWR